jgi:hypothetical protein
MGQVRPATSRKSTLGLLGPVHFFVIFVFPPVLHFLRMWSTLAGWLQHMPTLPDFSKKLQTPITFDS